MQGFLLPWTSLLSRDYRTSYKTINIIFTLCGSLEFLIKVEDWFHDNNDEVVFIYYFVVNIKMKYVQLFVN